MALKFNKRIAFGAYTYFERFAWFLIHLLPKFCRKLIYKIIFESFGKKVFIDEKCYFRYPWKISISDNVFINRGCEFYPSHVIPDSKIFLGQGVIIGPRVVFFGAGQNPNSQKRDDVSESILIKNGAYIGGNTTILYGVTVGENAVIGAGSVVVADVSANTLYAGNPAKYVKSILN